MHDTRAVYPTLARARADLPTVRRLHNQPTESNHYGTLDGTNTVHKSKSKRKPSVRILTDAHSATSSVGSTLEMTVRPHFYELYLLSCH